MLANRTMRAHAKRARTHKRLFKGVINHAWLLTLKARSDTMRNVKL